MSNNPNDKYYEALCSILDLKLENVVEGNKLIPFDKLLTHLNNLKQEYRISEHPKELYRIHSAKLQKTRATKLEREKKRAEWCAKNLKVGDWAKVTGTSTSKYRKIVALNKTTFYNLQGNPLENKTRNISWTTSYAMVAEVLNPATRIMEKIAV